MKKIFNYYITSSFPSYKLGEKTQIKYLERKTKHILRVFISDNSMRTILRSE